MKWIEKIIDVDHYTVKTLWNDGVLRLINLKDFIVDKSQNPNSSYAKLKDLAVFKTVKCDGNSLYWENLITAKDINGKEFNAQLDISPEFLFELASEEFKQVI